MLTKLYMVFQKHKIGIFAVKFSKFYQQTRKGLAREKDGRAQGYVTIIHFVFFSMVFGWILVLAFKLNLPANKRKIDVYFFLNINGLANGAVNQRRSWQHVTDYFTIFGIGINVGRQFGHRNLFISFGFFHGLIDHVP